ncbi:hypothetical protein HMPREF2532_01479 [Bacteroides ovatus]|nr:hypothetical protein HMPREF2532_01479 [Bacteroides ovatus]
MFVFVSHENLAYHTYFQAPFVNLSKIYLTPNSFLLAFICNFNPFHRE